MNISGVVVGVSLQLLVIHVSSQRKIHQLAVRKVSKSKFRKLAAESVLPLLNYKKR